MNDRSGNGTGSFEVKIKTNAAKFTNMITARFRESRHLVRKSEVHQRQNQGCEQSLSSNQ